LLECFAQDPGRKLGELDLVPPEERGRIAAALRRDAGHGAAPLLVIDAILERARRSPDAIAVETGEARRSYRECIGQAQAMAHSLVRDFGVRPGDTVALLLPRGADLISSQLAVMLAGGAFVPMDPRTPDIRARQIAEDSGVKCVITNAALVGKARVIHREALLADTLAGRAEPFPSRAEPEQVAYIIYTSGSTGKPKGVEISQRALADHLASWFQTVPLGGDGERHLLFQSAVFDASIEAIFPALMRGHTLVAAPHPQWTVFEIARVIVERRLTVLFLPPAYLLEFLKHLRDHPGQLAGHTVRLCLTGGETMHAETAPLWNEVFGRSAVLFNIYGPTECTVTATMFKVPAGYRAEPGESIPIGQPHRGRVLRIVDAHDRDVPLGAEGELLIGGIGLARGYRNLPAETAERFVVLADGRRYYRSGDIVRLKTDGNIVFRRRLDQQVKVRGFRIEPGEIEACVLTHPAVRECAVVARQNGPEGACELRAYVALREASGEDRHSLREYLSSRLPDYMLPAIFILDRLPKNAADKIDRPALLAEPVAPAQSPSDLPPDRRPNGAVQEYLALLWEQALGAKVDDVRADFFEIGGHSLLAAKLISSMGKAFRVEYPFSAFFDQPTIAETERRLEPLVGDRAKLEKMARVRLELARMSPAEIKARLEQTAPRRP
jgi:arthrofactin-type cyclic lipopeptide synthetase B